MQTSYTTVLQVHWQPHLKVSSQCTLLFQIPLNGCCSLQRLVSVTLQLLVVRAERSMRVPRRSTCLRGGLKLCLQIRHLGGDVRVFRLEGLVLL